MFKIIISELDSGAAEILIIESEYIIGRHEDCDIILHDKTVSRNHGRLILQGDDLLIEDLDSLAGIYINDKKISGTSWLKDKDIIRIGLSYLSIEQVVEEDDEDKTAFIDQDELNSGLYGGVFEEDKTGSVEFNDPDSFNPDKTALAQHGILTETFCKIVRIEGNEIQDEFVLADKETFLGRSPDCDLCVEDGLVSGCHAKFIVQDGGCYIEDLNSTNGTLVDDEPVGEPVMLEHKSLIKIGNLIFQFIDRDSITSKEELPSKGKVKTKKKREPKKIFAACLTGLLIAIIFFLFSGGDELGKIKDTKKSETEVSAQKKSRGKDGADLIGKAGKNKEEDTDSEFKTKQLKMIFTTANQLKDNRIWDAAIQRYQEILNGDPDYPGAVEALNQAVYEQKNSSYWNLAKELYEKENYGQTKENLKKIPPDSYYYARVPDFLSKVNLQERRKEEAENELEKEKNKRLAAEKAAQMQKQAQAAENRKKQAKESLKNAVSLYIRGDISKSISNLDTLQKSSQEDPQLAKEISGTKTRIRQTARSFQKGLESYNRGSYNQAQQYWSEALSTDQLISGSQTSQIASRIAQKLSSVYYDQAMKAYKCQDYKLAYTKSAMVLNSNKNHSGALEIQNKIDEMAKTLFEKGYILEDLNPGLAVKNWEDVLKICPPGHKYHDKAREKLSKYR